MNNRMKHYDFYQKLDARRSAVVTLSCVIAFSAAFLYFLWRFFLEPDSFAFILTAIWVIGLFIFVHVEIPYVRSGGQWLLCIQDGILQVDFPSCEAKRSFQISIDDIVEIQKNYDRRSNVRPVVMLLTGPRKGHILPEPREINTELLLKTLMSLRPDLPYRINGKLRK
jgi:hypothetical protein